jgi:hypothetical protein
MKQLNYNLLFRWLVGLEMDDPIWDVSVFTKYRERLIAGEASQRLLEAVLVETRAHDLLSHDFWIFRPPRTFRIHCFATRRPRIAVRRPCLDDTGFEIQPKHPTITVPYPGSPWRFEAQVSGHTGQSQ